MVKTPDTCICYNIYAVVNQIQNHSKKYLLRYAVVLTLLSVVNTPTSVYAQQAVSTNDYGYTGFESNELTVGSQKDDPAKVRISSPITEHGGGGGVLSYNFHRFFGVAFGGQQCEMAMIRVEQAEDVRGSFDPKAEFNFLANDGGGCEDVNMTKPLAFTAHHITRLDTGIAADLAARIAPYLPGGMQQPSSDKLVSGRFELDLQSADGNIVLYNQQCDGSYNAVWTMLTGFIRRPPYVTRCQ